MGKWNGTRTGLLALAGWLFWAGGSSVFAQCEGVTNPTAELGFWGDVLVEWSYASCIPVVRQDTIHHHSDGLAGGFFVQGSDNEEVVAVPLPHLPPGAQVRSVRAYLFGSGEASVSQWRLKAGMWCSLHWDSSGYPGAPIDGSHYWPVGDHDSLFSGGWYTDSSGWTLNLHDTTSLWLAVHWLPETSRIIRLGRDSLTAARPFVAGVGANPVWNRLYWPGLLIDVVVDNPPTVDPEAASRTVVISREDRSLENDTAVMVLDTLPACAQAFCDSGPPDAAEVRYSIVALCDTLTGLPAWTPALQTPDAVAATVSPTYLSMAITLGDTATLAIDLDSDDPDSLYALISQEDTLSGEGGPLLAFRPDSMLIPPHGAGTCLIRVDATGAAIGFHAKVLRVTMVDPRSGDSVSVDVLFEVIVDQQTDVSDGAVEGRTSRDWDVRPLQNPFTDQLGVQVSVGAVLTEGATGPSIHPTGIGEVEVSVFDILGRLMAVVTEPWTDDRAMGGDGAIIRINGTTTWASGVYICRVRIGRSTRSVKLTHVK